jgi:collagenase-like PrtC family protease
VLNSGRVIGALPEADYKVLENYVNYSKKYNIDFNYTLNPACMGNLEFSRKGIREIIGLLKILSSIGIQNLTITTPALIEIIKSLEFAFKIKASAICEIMSPDKALFYKNAGVDRVVVDPDITRDFERLRNISRVMTGNVEIIVNNVCYKNCAYKMFHYNHEAHCIPGNALQDFNDYYYGRCAMQKAGDLKNVIRLSWIRPEDLHYYMQSGITYFKIQGRQNVLKGDPVKAVEYYIKEDYEGNLYDLITIFAPYTSFQPFIDNKKLDNFVKKFFDNPHFCRNICAECRYCESYAKKSMDQEKTAELNREARSYFEEVDNFSQVLREEKKRGQKKNVLPGENSLFDFE